MISAPEAPADQRPSAAGTPEASLRASRGRMVPSRRFSRHTRLGLGAAVLCSALALSACGSSSASTARTSEGSAPPPVATVDTDTTAVMVTAASSDSSALHEATFTLTARTATGRPAVGEPVSFWVGPMTPLSGVSPAAWYQTGTAPARAYVVSASSRTDGAGQARIVLFGQPAGSMEMVAVRIGDLDSFDASLGRGEGLLDAWWTTPKSMPTAPVGDRVTVTPFLAAVRPGAATRFVVRVTDAAGKPVAGAGVELIAHPPTSGSMMGSSSMGSSSMASSGTSTRSATTDGAGEVSERVAASAMAPVVLRVVVTEPGSTDRVAGGMAALLVGRT